MKYYFIITKGIRVLHLQPGKNKTDATDNFNCIFSGDHIADIVMEAISCPHQGKFVLPDLPEWMNYEIAKDAKVCMKCSTPVEVS